MGAGGLLSTALRSVVDPDMLNCLTWLEVREVSSGCAGDPHISAVCGQKNGVFLVSPPLSSLSFQPLKICTFYL